MRRGRDRRHRLGQARAGRGCRSRNSARGRRRGATCKRRPAMRAKRRSIGNLLAAFLTEHRSTFRGLAFIRAKSKTLSRHHCCATLGESAKPHACPAPGPPCGKPVHTNMGHMAHLSRLPGSANWGIQGSTRLRIRSIKSAGTQPRGGSAASALPSLASAHIATYRRKSDPQNGTHGPP